MTQKAQQPQQSQVSLATLIKPDELEVFKYNTQALAEQSERFITEYYPSYISTNEYINSLLKKDSISIINSLTFYKLDECRIDENQSNTQAQNKSSRSGTNLLEYFSKKLQKLFTTAYSIMQPICYGIVSYEGETSLVLGIAPTEKEDKDTIKQIIEGLLPGITLSEFTGKFKNAQQEKLPGNPIAYDKDRYIGCISGVPALKQDGQYLNKDLSSLMRSLNGKNYTIMVMASPVDNLSIQNKIDEAIEIKDKCIQISKQTVSIQQSVANTNTQTNGTAVTNSVNKAVTNNNGVNMSGTLPGAMAGAGVGALAGGPAGAIIGGLAGLFVGKQVNFNKGKAKTTGEGHAETISYSDAVSESISQSGSLAFDVQNGYALELIQMADTVIERLKTGRSIGMWDMTVSYSSDSKIVRDIIQGSLYSEIASGDPNTLPPITFATKDQCMEAGKILKTHATHLLIPDHIEGNQGSQGQGDISSMVTSEELCGICTIPTENVPGFEIKRVKSYPINCPSSTQNDIVIGKVCEFNREINNIQFSMSEDDVVKHTFICGITGSGKTTTVKNLLCNTSKPFLVIEPAKKEYRNIAKDNVTVYTLGRPEINCLRFNPFYIMPGINPQQHVDLLKDLFSASFSFYGPMPYIFEKCLHNIYIKKGWNLTLGFHPHLVNQSNPEELFDSDKIQQKYALDSHRYLFPTMQDLKDEVDSYIENNTDYEGEVKGNIRSAIKSRIDSLCVGAKGYMFNTTQMTDFKQILSSNTVFELEGLADDSDKAFALGLLIIFINEHRQTEKELNGPKQLGLKHILVIEEAHRLLKNVSTEHNEDVGNPKGKAVDHFTNLLAEMRSYGQGVIIAEQIPSKLAPDVIKNSSNKIIHRIVAADDQQVIANTIGISTEDAIHLGINNQGYALCHKGEMALPVLVKVNQTEDEATRTDHSLYKAGMQEKLQSINISIIQNTCNRTIKAWAVKTLNSLLLNQNNNDNALMESGLEDFVSKIENELRIDGVSIIQGIRKDTCIRVCLADIIANLLVNGIYSQKDLPSNKQIKLLNQFIKIPSKKNQYLLLDELEIGYKPQTMKNIAINNLANLLCVEFVTGEDILKKVNEFLIAPNEEITQEVKQKLERRMELCR